MTWRRVLDLWWLGGCYSIVGASFPWAGLILVSGRPIDALFLLFNTFLAMKFLQGLEV